MSTLLREFIKSVLTEVSPGQTPKVIFMAGAPGSGKSTVIKALGLKDRLEIINPDDQYEADLEAEGLPKDTSELLDKYKPLKDEYMQAVESGDEQKVAEFERPDSEYSQIRSVLSRNMSLFNKARKAAKETIAGHVETGGEFLVDGTGGNYNEIKTQVDKFTSVGYDVAMVFVELSLEDAKARNIKRGKAGGRRLRNSAIERSWNAVTRNKSKYEALFGNNFFAVDASEENFDSSVNQISSGVNAFLGSAR